VSAGNERAKKMLSSGFYGKNTQAKAFFVLILLSFNDNYCKVVEVITNSPYAFFPAFPVCFFSSAVFLRGENRLRKNTIRFYLPHKPEQDNPSKSHISRERQRRQDQAGVMIFRSAENVRFTSLSSPQFRETILSAAKKKRRKPASSQQIK